MFETNLNARIIVTIIAVTLSMSFFSDPSLSVRFRDLKELEKPFVNGRYTDNDQVDIMTKEIFLRKNETDGWHTFAYYIGLISAWPVADRLGRKRGIVFSNLFRIMGIIFHFFAIIAATCLCSNPNITIKGRPNDLYILNNTLNITDVSPAFVSISLSSKLADGLYTGLTTVLGILYVYEISPKATTSSSKVGSVSIMAFYLFMKSAAEYIMVVLIPPLQYSPINYLTWYISGVLTILAGLTQITLLSKFCPESAPYLAVQRGKSEEAKEALIQFRGTDQVAEELEEIQKDASVREFLKRSMFLVSLYMVFALYNGFFLFMGFAHGLELGVSLVTSVNAYWIINIVSLLIPVFCFGNLSVGQVKKALFSYYLLLGILYFLSTVLLTINLFIAPSLFESNKIVAALIVAVCCVTTVVYSSGPALLTSILAMEYTNQRERSKNLILSWISGIIVTSKAVAFFALIFIKALFLYYVVFQTFPWLFLGCVTWFVWKFETVGYGARFDVDGNGNLHCARNANKPETEVSNA